MNPFSLTERMNSPGKPSILLRHSPREGLSSMKMQLLCISIGTYAHFIYSPSDSQIYITIYVFIRGPFLKISIRKNSLPKCFCSIHG